MGYNRPHRKDVPNGHCTEPHRSIGPQPDHDNRPDLPRRTICDVDGKLHQREQEGDRPPKEPEQHPQVIPLRVKTTPRDNIKGYCFSQEIHGV
jgi:hypothetical protein